MAISNDNSPPRRPEQQNDPAIGAVAISYGGGNQDLEGYAVRGIHVNTGSTLAVVMLDGTSATFTMTPGQVYPYRIRTIVQTGSDVAGYVLV
jgi:hypothetical protein